jgi:hypothetical protein
VWISDGGGLPYCPAMEGLHLWKALEWEIRRCCQPSAPNSAPASPRTTNTPPTTGRGEKRRAAPERLELADGVWQLCDAVANRAQQLQPRQPPARAEYGAQVRPHPVEVEGAQRAQAREGLGKDLVWSGGRGGTGRRWVGRGREFWGGGAPGVAFRAEEVCVHVRARARVCVCVCVCVCVQIVGQVCADCGPGVVRVISHLHSAARCDLNSTGQHGLTGRNHSYLHQGPNTAPPSSTTAR